MADLLKNRIDRELVEKIALLIQQQDSHFSKQKFINHVLNKNWNSLELKQRVRHITESLSLFLNVHTFKQQISILKHVAPHVRGLGGMIFPDFIEVYGQNDLKQSVAALKFFTPFFSSEFAIRPFIQKYPEQMMETLLLWTQDSNEHVRRLASEGCRPRLPWSFPLNNFKKDPSPVLKVLELLKNDPSLYVRKSVANNLNDISKDHPQLVLKLATLWIDQSDATNWILKHALRTLLKKGDQKALSLFGLGKIKNITSSHLKFEKKHFLIGTHLAFSFELHNLNAKNVNLRVEYAIEYVTKSKKPSRKVFKLSEKQYPPGAIRIERRHSLKQMTTRKHYPGRHKLEIIVNGERHLSENFFVK